MALVIVVYSGNAEPYLSVSQLPGGGSENPELYLFGMATALILAGVIVIQALKRRAWTRMGRRTDLSASDGGIFGHPDLTGTIRGRPVRVHTISRKTSGGGSQSGSSTQTYTVVEAILEEPTDLGLMLGLSDPGETVNETEVGGTSIRTHGIDDRFVVVGSGPEQLARDVLTGHVRQTLLELGSFEKLTIGDPMDTILEAMPDMSGTFLGGMAQEKLEQSLREKQLGNESAVAIETKGVLLDSEHVQRQLDAVVAVADSFEAAVEDNLE